MSGSPRGPGFFDWSGFFFGGPPPCPSEPKTSGMGVLLERGALRGCVHEAGLAVREPGEVRPVEVRSLERARGERRPAEVGPREVRAAEVAREEERAAEVRALEV